MTGKPSAWWIAACVECGPDMPQPFRDEGDRDRWADGHAETGHTLIRVDQGEDGSAVRIQRPSQ